MGANAADAAFFGLSPPEPVTIDERQFGSTRSSSVIRPARLLDHAPIRICPGHQGHDRGEKRPADCGQFVIHARWDRREEGSTDRAVPFQSTKRNREHSLRDAVDLPSQCIEADRPILQGHEDVKAPLVGNAIEAVERMAGLPCGCCPPRLMLCFGLLWLACRATRQTACKEHPSGEAEQ